MVFLKYLNTYKHVLGAVNFGSDTIKAALLKAHTPNRTTHEFFDDVDGDEVPATGGYSAGGVTLGSKTVAPTPANSWSVQWQAETAYAVGTVVRPTTGNGHLYECIVAGTSHTGEPSWPTVTGEDVDDATVTWQEVGTGITVIDAADPSWGPGATIEDISHLVIYKDTGDPATSPLLGLADLDGPLSVSNGTFSGQFSAAQGIWNHFTT